MEQFFRNIIKFRVLVLVLGFTGMAITASFLPSIVRDTSVDAFISPDNPARICREYVKEVFGLADTLITITQYSMTTARGMVLVSASFDSVEHAVQLPSLCLRIHSIVIKNNKAGAGSVYDPDFSIHQDQLEQELGELFPDEFNKT